MQAPQLGIEMMLAPTRRAVKGTQRVSRGPTGNELAMTWAWAKPAVTPECLACTSVWAGDFTETRTRGSRQGIVARKVPLRDLGRSVK